MRRVNLPSWKRLLWIPVFLGVGIGVLTWMARQPGDMDRQLARLKAQGIPTTSAELDVWYAAVPDAVNAGKLVLEAASGFRTVALPGLEADSQRRPSRTNGVTESLLLANRAYLATNAETLHAIHAALQHPQSRYPILLTNGVLTLLPHLSPVKQAAQRLGVCAEMAAECGDRELATQCLLDGLALARTLQPEPTVISFLVRNVCEGIATASAERVLHRVELNSNQLSQLQRAFNRSAAELSYDRAMVGELCLNLDAFRMPAGRQWTGLVAPGGPNPALQPEAVVLWVYSISGLKGRDLAVMANYYNRSRELAALPPTARHRASETLNAELDAQLRTQFLPIAHMMLPGILKTESKATHQYAVLRSAEVACAVEQWRQAHGGALPESLNALVPGPLASIPEDPLDGRPLKFVKRPRGFVVYSVGEDGIDDGGAVRNVGSTNRWDYTFTVER